MTEELKTIDTVDSSPFKKMVLTIGELPSSFVESMTYYELLAWLCNYLQSTVIPAVNNNGEAVTELQQLYVELKSYVDNYFDNLDVQDEIDHKLDEMVEDGVFDTIINQELFGEINDRLDLLDTPKVLLIGDSYLKGYNGEEDVNSWGYYFKQAAGLDNTNCYTLYESGAGFIKEGGQNHTFLTLLQSDISNITNKDKYNSVIVGYGLNDPNQGTASDIKTAMATFITYVKGQFPNAKIYFACVGNTKKNSSSHRTTRQRIIDRCIKAGKDCMQYGIIWMNGVEQVAHDYSLFGADDIHLSQDGYQQLGYAIYDAWKNGSTMYTTTYKNSTLTVAGGDLENASDNIGFATAIYGATKDIHFNAFNISFDAFAPSSNIIKFTGSDETALDGFNAFRTVFVKNPVCNIYVMITHNDNTTSWHYGYFTIDDNGFVEFVTDTSIKNVSIKAIRLFGAVECVLSTLIS